MEFFQFIQNMSIKTLEAFMVQNLRLPVCEMKLDSERTLSFHSWAKQTKEICTNLI